MQTTPFGALPFGVQFSFFGARIAMLQSTARSVLKLFSKQVTDG